MGAELDQKNGVLQERGIMQQAYEKEYALEERVVDLLKQRGFTATTTESCTGGLLAGRLLNVPGASGPRYKIPSS